MFKEYSYENNKKLQKSTMIFDHNRIIEFIRNRGDDNDTDPIMDRKMLFKRAVNQAVFPSIPHQTLFINAIEKHNGEIGHGMTVGEAFDAFEQMFPLFAERLQLIGELMPDMLCMSAWYPDGDMYDPAWVDMIEKVDEKLFDLVIGLDTSNLLITRSVSIMVHDDALTKIKSLTLGDFACMYAMRNPIVPRYRTSRNPIQMMRWMIYEQMYEIRFAMFRDLVFAMGSSYGAQNELINHHRKIVRDNWIRNDIRNRLSAFDIRSAVLTMDLGQARDEYGNDELARQTARSYDSLIGPTLSTLSTILSVNMDYLERVHGVCQELKNMSTTYPKFLNKLNEMEILYAEARKRV